MGVHASLACVVLLLFLVRDEGDVWLLYVVSFLYGIGGTFGQPTRAALVKVTVPDELLGEANALLQTVHQGFRVVAPLLGAGLYAAVGGAAVAVLDAATFAVSVAALALLRIREPEPHPREHRFLREVSAGARHIWDALPLRQLVAAAAAALVVIGFAESLIFAVVDEGLGRAPAFLGVLEVFQGLGAIVGGVTAARALRRFGDGPLAGIGLVLFAVGDTLLISTSLVVVFVGFAIAGFGLAWLVVGFVTALQRRTPVHLQGRVTATATMAYSIPQTFSIALGAILVTFVDYRLLLVVMGFATALSGAYLLTRRTFRDAPVTAPVEVLPVAPDA
jgi:MFS family permease